MQKERKNKMYLLGVSGGPDSMYLLNMYKDKYPNDIYVACVNYNVRENSSYDTSIVIEYCKKYNIPFSILEIDKNEYKTGNFEKWARDIRMDFFKNIYTILDCEALVLAHHKDDFLESAFMQHDSKRNVLYYGIKSKNYIYGMQVIRPLVHKVYKSQIIKYLDKHGIKYAIDETNDQPIYTRNKVRQKLNGLTLKQKESMYKLITRINNRLSNIEDVAEIEFRKWFRTWFSQTYFSNKVEHKKEVVYRLIHAFYDDIKLSGGKIQSIVDFIVGTKKPGKYILKDNVYISKEHGKIQLTCSKFLKKESKS